MSYQYLPGIQVKTNDGGLYTRRNPVTKSILIFGTAGQGVANEAYQVIDQNLAAQEYGFAGTLIRGMSECAAGDADNMYLFRIGTAPAVLSGVGKTTTGGTGPANLGISITFNGSVDVDAATKYTLYYTAGILYVWNDGQLVYANDTGIQVVDTGDISVTLLDAAFPSAGATIGTAKTLAGSVAIGLAATAAVSDTHDPVPTYTDVTTGLNLTNRQLYIAIQKAMDIMEGFICQQVFIPNTVLDAPNVAFYVSSDTTTVQHNPSTNTNALDWLKTTVDSVGNKVYRWASELVDSNGSIVTAHASWVGAADRQADGFYEVNFGYQLARFCANNSELQQGNGVCIGFIGMSGPARNTAGSYVFSSVNVRSWLGAVPVYSQSTGAVTASGRGQFGNPYMAGCAAAQLNLLCADKSTGRAKGFFENLASEYDGGASIDENQMPIDIGAYLVTVGEWGGLINSYGQYVGSAAGLWCGFVAQLDEKESTTNKPLKAISQLYHPTMTQLNVASQLGIHLLRFHTNLDLPRIDHGQTSATRNSDFDELVRVRIKGKVIQEAWYAADPFIGSSSTDGMQLLGLQTALDKRMQTLRTNGYIGGVYYISIKATPAQMTAGQCDLYLTYYSPDEVKQITIHVGLTRQ